MTTTTTLVYTVPVHVVVSDTTREILSVGVVDESVEGIDMALDSGGNVLDPLVDLERIKRAVKVADEKDWPTWVVGP